MIRKMIMNEDFFRWKSFALHAIFNEWTNISIIEIQWRDLYHTKYMFYLTNENFQMQSQLKHLFFKLKSSTDRLKKKGFSC